MYSNKLKVNILKYNCWMNATVVVVQVLYFGENVSNNCPIFRPQYKNSLFLLAFRVEVCVLRGRDGHTELGLLLSRKWDHSCLKVCRVLLSQPFHQHGHFFLGLWWRQTKEEFKVDRKTLQIHNRAKIQQSADNINVQGLTEDTQWGETFNRSCRLCCVIFFFFDIIRFTDALKPKTLSSVYRK